MAGKFKLTKTNLDRDAKPVAGKQVVYWDDSLIGFGIRVSPGGTKTFFYQGRLNGKLKKVTIGRYGTITPESARKQAKQIQSKMELGKNPRPESAAPAKKTGTLGDLLTAYVDDLESRGKVSASAVRNSIHKNVRDACPQLWKREANQVDVDDCIFIVKNLVVKEHNREADKVRSYLKSAYTAAINARADATASPKMVAMKIKHNPAGDLRKVRDSSNARERVLSLAEFRAYWKRIQTLPEPQRSLLMLHVLTGGQRQRQLSRLTWDDYDADTRTVTIADTKGKRDKPRRHVVPLLPICVDLLHGITGAGDYLFSTNGGVSPMSPEYLTDHCKRVSLQMQEAGELSGEPFTAGAIRATVETRLMKKPYRVSSDVLGQLLSHGTGGVQQRHYQHDDFADEKYEALEMLHRMVEDQPEPGAQVVQFNRGAVA